MSIIILIIILILGFFGIAVADEPDCGPDGCVAVEETTPAWQPVSINGLEGVIVAEADGPQFDIFVTADGYWTPAVADLEAAEAAIAADQGALDHLRQYVGYLEDGQRKILVNGFCDPFGYAWQAEPVFVMDGGDCYFQAVYNVDDAELESFSFHGEA
jgi:hypothetical protein